MKKARLGFALLVSLSLAGAGCGGGIPHIMEGRPAYVAGSPLAYWVWHDDGGWHLRTTTAAHKHRFTGWVEAVGGRIKEVKTTRLEWNDRIKAVRRGIEFDFETDGADDGFDWRVSSGCNRFHLEVDGVVTPAAVHVGRDGRQPEHVPFERCT